jgi:hypothetical protein
MKKSILIICAVLTTFSLTALGYMKWNDKALDHDGTSCAKAVLVHEEVENAKSKKADLDLVYHIDSRFIWNITKEDLHKAKSITDIVPKKATQSLVSYSEVKVAVLGEENEISETGDHEVLNDAQRKLLRSTDYSTNFHVSARCKQKNEVTGALEDYHLVYYITIVPEQEASYENGPEALIEYLRENTKDQTASIEEYKLQPGRYCFTVLKDGTIANVKLESTSGYHNIDLSLVELLSAMPGKWVPATNAKGEPVDQELIFFFGKQGC